MTWGDRFQWSLEMQSEHAVDIYESYFDLDSVIELDVMAEEKRGLKPLDYSGIDKILSLSSGVSLHVAQRFRMPYEQDNTLKKPDFSLRYKTYDDSDKTEYQKLREAHQHSLATPPALYAFGRTEYGRQPALNNGFEDFFLIDLRHLIRAHFDYGYLEPIGVNPNGDGSAGLYFDIDDLRSIGCILHEFDFTDNATDRQEVSA